MTIPRTAKHISAAVALLAIFLAGCSGGYAANLKELGFYTVTSGKTTHTLFKEYGSGSTHRRLPSADFPYIPRLSGKDHLLLYGDMPSGPMGTTVEVFRYKKDGDTYVYSGDDFSVEAFFSSEPMEPVKGQKLTKLVPRKDMTAGIYFVHRYVGMNGDAYFGITIP